MMTTPAHQRLRAATAPLHARVDSKFGGYRLSDRESYTAFLTAHARALPPIEAALAGDEELPSFRPRTLLLGADLAALGATMPAPLPVPPLDGEAARWGALYVIEGSRLGGVMLSRQIPEALPRAYLSAAHEAGGWRAFLEAFDAHAAAGGETWFEDAFASAERTFALYERAAAA